LDESQRDNRLLSISDKDLLSNGNPTVSDINKQEKYLKQTSMNNHASVECDLQKAEWEQVNIFYITIYILSMILFF